MSWIIVSVCIVGAIVVASGLIFSISSFRGGTLYPHLASYYQGTLQNTTSGGTTILILTIVQNQQNISGRMTLGPGWIGSGPFTGTVGTDNSISFTVTADDGSSAVTKMTGSVTPQNTLSGSFSGHSPLTILSDQHGTWEASANTTNSLFSSGLWRELPTARSFFSFRVGRGKQHNERDHAGVS